nr:MAG TPA: hypothetical protein [Crassvirales sp.]
MLLVRWIFFNYIVNIISNFYKFVIFRILIYFIFGNLLSNLVNGIL